MPQSAHDTNIIHHHQSTHNNNCHHQLTTSSAISSSSTMSSSPSDDMVPLNKSSPEGSVAKSAASLATGINGGFSPNTLSGVMSAERSAKVSRCFGNTNLCMPQTLLCFKVRLCT